MITKLLRGGKLKILLPGEMLKIKILVEISVLSLVCKMAN